MLLNLTSRYSVKARNHPYGGLYCDSSRGPSFGFGDLRACEPMLGEKNIISYASGHGYMIGGSKGTLKQGDINPLTGDKLIEEYEDLFTESTAT